MSHQQWVLVPAPPPCCGGGSFQIKHRLAFGVFPLFTSILGVGRSTGRGRNLLLLFQLSFMALDSFVSVPSLLCSDGLSCFQ